MNADMEGLFREAQIARTAMAHGASQEENELRQAISMVAALQPRVIVELGCDRGGTLYAWRQLCDRVYGITWASNADSGGAPCQEHGAVVRYGDTHNPDSLAWLLAQLKAGERVMDPVDVLIVDGDHYEAGIILDLRWYAPLVRPGGLIMMHDVAPTYYPAVEVHKVWPRIRERYDAIQIGTTFGWGVIRVREGDEFGDFA